MELSKPFHRKKIVVIFLACILIFSGLSARVVYLMVFRAAHYSELALDLHQRERKIKAKRGRILDRNGIVLADNQPVCTISVIHNQIRDPNAVIALLCSKLGLSEETVRKRVEKVSSIGKKSKAMSIWKPGRKFTGQGWTASRWTRIINDIIRMRISLPK